MDSDYSVRLATLEAMGGDTTKHYNSVYDIDMEILALTEQGGGGSGSGGLAPDAGFNYATSYIDDETGLEGKNIATGNYSNFAEGSKTKATSSYGGNHAEGYLSEATGGYACHAEGYAAKATGECSHAEGSQTTSAGGASHAEGESTVTSNFAEHAEGIQNVSHRVSTDTTSSGNTRHSIGIGQWGNTSDRKNAVEVMANGDVYIRGIGDYDGINLSGDTLQAVISSILTRLTALEPQPTNPPLNQIWYKTTTGQPVAGSVGYSVYDENGDSNSVVSNTYQNGKGVITFDSSIGSMAYWGSEEDCGNIIEKVWLPYVTEEGSVAYMLSSQTNLTDVYYPGTTTEAAVICTDFEAEPMSGALTNVIHCSDGDYTVPSA